MATVIALFSFINGGSAQIIWAGAKIGGGVQWVKMESKGYLDTVKIQNPSIYLNLGGVISFKVKDRYFLQTEYLYSLRQKQLRGKIDPDLKDKITYHYIEVPVLFTMQFKRSLEGDRNIKWYLGAGPNLSYLLAGSGKIESGELKEFNIDAIKYKIKFNSRENRDHNDEIHYPKANRFQFGINLGSGLIIEPSKQQKIILDLRYTFDQTFFGKGKADYIIPHDFDDNLKFRNRSLKLSAIYVLQYNLNKKERNKGKSTIQNE